MNNLKPNIEEFELRGITQETTVKILNYQGASRLPKPDEISPKILQDGEEVLTKPQCDPFNLSIKLSTFPDECKIHLRLIPNIRGNFTEKAIHVQTQEYLDINDLLYKFQSSLRKKFQPIFDLFN